MPEKILGIHHITAIATSAKKNHAFYTEVLGLRLVKKTVNFDDPTTYHFYYGKRRGREGTGQVTAASFSVPGDSMSFWLNRFRSHNVTYNNPSSRFGEEVLVFLDPDGLKLELVFDDGDGRRA